VRGMSCANCTSSRLGRCCTDVPRLDAASRSSDRSSKRSGTSKALLHTCVALARSDGWACRSLHLAVAAFVLHPLHWHPDTQPADVNYSTTHGNLELWPHLSLPRGTNDACVTLVACQFKALAPAGRRRCLVLCRLAAVHMAYALLAEHRACGLIV
jgi:hypothetical protein